MERLANLLGVTALAAADRLRAAVESELAHGGSSPAALVHLQAYPGESVEGLRRVVGVSQPAAVRVVDRLVREGLVERRSGPDRRTLALHFTPAGERAACELLSRRTLSLRSLLAQRPRLVVGLSWAPAARSSAAMRAGPTSGPR